MSYYPDEDPIYSRVVSADEALSLSRTAYQEASRRQHYEVVECLNSKISQAIRRGKESVDLVFTDEVGDLREKTLPDVAKFFRGLGYQVIIGEEDEPVKRDEINMYVSWGKPYTIGDALIDAVNTPDPCRTTRRKITLITTAEDVDTWGKKGVWIINKGYRVNLYPAEYPLDPYMFRVVGEIHWGHTDEVSPIEEAVEYVLGK